MTEAKDKRRHEAQARAPCGARSTFDDPLVEFPIHDLDRLIDLSVGRAKLMLDSLSLRLRRGISCPWSPAWKQTFDFAPNSVIQADRHRSGNLSFFYLRCVCRQGFALGGIRPRARWTKATLAIRHR